MSVKIGGNAITGANVIYDSLIEGLTPASGDIGFVDVTIHNSTGTQIAISTGGFEYKPTFTTTDLDKNNVVYTSDAGGQIILAYNDYGFSVDDATVTIMSSSGNDISHSSPSGSVTINLQDEGENTIIITLRDNSTGQEVEQVFSTVWDKTDPDIASDGGLTGALTVDTATASSSAVLAGKVTEDYLKRITVNGVLAKINGSTWVAQGIDLPNYGLNDVEIIATDESGRTTSKTIQIRKLLIMNELEDEVAKWWSRLDGENDDLYSGEFGKTSRWSNLKGHIDNLAEICYVKSSEDRTSQALGLHATPIIPIDYRGWKTVKDYYDAFDNVTDPTTTYLEAESHESDLEELEDKLTFWIERTPSVIYPSTTYRDHKIGFDENQTLALNNLSTDNQTQFSHYLPYLYEESYTRFPGTDIHGVASHRVYHTEPIQINNNDTRFSEYRFVTLHQHRRGEKHFASNKFDLHDDFTKNIGTFTPGNIGSYYGLQKGNFTNMELPVPAPAPPLYIFSEIKHYWNHKLFLYGKVDEAALESELAPSEDQYIPVGGNVTFSGNAKYLGPSGDVKFKFYPIYDGDLGELVPDGNGDAKYTGQVPGTDQIEGLGGETTTIHVYNLYTIAHIDGTPKGNSNDNGDTSSPIGVSQDKKITFRAYTDPESLNQDFAEDPVWEIYGFTNGVLDSEPFDSDLANGTSGWNAGTVNHGVIVDFKNLVGGDYMVRCKYKNLEVDIYVLNLNVIFKESTSGYGDDLTIEVSDGILYPQYCVKAGDSSNIELKIEGSPNLSNLFFEIDNPHLSITQPKSISGSDMFEITLTGKSEFKNLDNGDLQIRIGGRRGDVSPHKASVYSYVEVIKDLTYVVVIDPNSSGTSFTPSFNYSDANTGSANSNDILKQAVLRFNFDGDDNIVYGTYDLDSDGECKVSTGSEVTNLLSAVSHLGDYFMIHIKDHEFSETGINVGDYNFLIKDHSPSSTDALGWLMAHEFFHNYFSLHWKQSGDSNNLMHEGYNGSKLTNSGRQLSGHKNPSRQWSTVHE